MTKTVALIGKIGPAFGTQVRYSTFGDVAHSASVDESGYLDAMMSDAADTIARDGDFAGYAAPPVPCGLCEAGEPSIHNCGNA